MTAKRDTVVLPILYNTRHAIELILKYAINRLSAIGMLSGSGRLDHDIKTYFTLLEQANLGDEALRERIRDLGPFVESLSRIDKDGQALRYHIRRDGNQSLSNYSLANLQVIRDSLAELSKALLALRDRIEDIVHERATKTYTKKLSRRDLIAIAGNLRELDPGKRFFYQIRKRRVLSRYKLSEDDFRKAVDVITSNREMKALVGGETSLLYLPDQTIVAVVRRWRELHPRRTETEPKIVTLNELTLKEIMEASEKESEIFTTIQALLTDEQIAELETVYSLGRVGGFPEFHEDRTQQTIERHRIEADTRKQIMDLFDKTNFLDAVVKALHRLGQPSLADRLSKM
jgi:hypothetical protein